MKLMDIDLARDGEVMIDSHEQRATAPGEWTSAMAGGAGLLGEYAQ
jgi:hypothetical protein